MNRSPKTIGVFQILLASVGFGFLGTFSRLAKAEGIETGTLLTYRFALASLILFAYLFLFRRNHLKISKKEFLLCLGLGVCGYTVFSTLYFTSIQTVSIALAALLLYTYPFWIMVLHFLFGHRPHPSEIVLLTSALLGMVLLLWGPLQMQSTVGILCGLGAAITYAIYILVSEKHQKNSDVLASSFYIILFAALGLWIAHSPLQLPPWELHPKTLWIIFGIATISTIGPLTLVLASLQNLNSRTVSLLSLTEPVTAILLSSLIFSESLTAIQWVGATIVLVTLGLKASLPV